MNALSENYLPLAVWLGFVALLVFFALMYRWAKKQKGAALAFGMLVQILLPDPKVQHTIECVAESKSEQKREQALPSDVKSKKR